MDLGLWGSLWANCALGATILTLPAAQLVQGGAVPNFGASFLSQDAQVGSRASTDNCSSSSEEEEEEENDDDEDNDEARSKTKSPDKNNTEEVRKNENMEQNSMDNEYDDSNDMSSDSECVKTNNKDDNDNLENRKRYVNKGKKYKSNLQRIRYSREEYRCSLCSYTCTTEKAFFKHLRTCESKDKSSGTEGSVDEPRLSCPVCGKDRNGEQSLSVHMRKHRDNRYFCCDICAFRTVQLKKLIQHRRMHTGERPHLCPHCSYRSARRDNLRSHVRRVHKKENLTCDTFSPRGMLIAPSRSK